PTPGHKDRSKRFPFLARTSDKQAQVQHYDFFFLSKGGATCSSTGSRLQPGRYCVVTIASFPCTLFEKYHRIIFLPTQEHRSSTSHA
ncbi:unnamed protein product, partial [Amoebophrya sp. A120]